MQYRLTVSGAMSADAVNQSLGNQIEQIASGARMLAKHFVITHFTMVEHNGRLDAFALGMFPPTPPQAENRITGVVKVAHQ